MYRSHVLVCGGTGCTSSHSNEIIEKLESEIAAKGLQDEIKVRYFDAPDLQNVGKNAYRFINAVSDMATHAKPIRETKNYRENLFKKTMEGNALIDKAYQMVMAA